MIAVFAGSDNFESYKACKNHALKLSKEKDSEIKIIDADEVSDISQFTQLLEGLGMFGGSFIVFAKRVFKNKRLLNFISDNFANLNKYDLIIWEDGKLDSRLKFVKDNKNKMLILNFELPKEFEFKSWLKSEAKQRNLNLTSDQINKIASYTEINKYRALTELDKITIFLKSQSKISNDDLERILGISITGDIWKFVENISTRNKLHAILEMEKITKFENNTAYLIAMIDRELNLLTQVKILEKNKKNISEIKAHPFVLKKAQQNAKNFELTNLKRLYRKLLDLDFSIKSGDIDEKLGLTLFLNLI